MTTGSRIRGTYSVGPSYYQKSWSGGDDPAHKAWNTYTMSLTKYDRTKTIGIRDSTGAVVSDSYLYSPMGGVYPDPLSGELENKLLAKVVDSVRGHSFNAAVFAAELGQTRDLVLAALHGFHGIVQGTKARNIAMVTRAFAAMSSGRRLSTVAKSKVTSGDISGTILATYYGWIPLVTDVYEAMSAFEQRTRNPRTIRFSRGISGPDEFRVAVKLGDYGPSDPANKVFWRGKRNVSLQVEFYETLSVARALGLYNPLSVVWEKVPWSFVFDWFIPIGTYLDNLGVIPFLKMRYLRSDYARATYHSWNGHPWVRLGNTYLGGHIEGETVKLDRTKGTQLSVPPPSLKRIEDALSLPHLRNAAALIHQAIRRR